jgi:hypothetical protein
MQFLVLLKVNKKYQKVKNRHPITNPLNHSILHFLSV